MANSKYIKVTPKGETKPRIVLASLKQFFISQRAKVEPVTDEEVYQLEPALRPARPAAPAPGPAQTAQAAAEAAKALQAIAELKKENLHFKEQNGELEKTIDGLQGDVKEKDELIAELREKLAASEAALTETENALEAARKELAAKERKPKASE
jgi:hypothetical protein